MKKQIALAVAAILLTVNLAPAGTVTIVGNGAGGGPILVTSSLGNIDLGTRLRVGTFNDISLLTTTISNFTSGTANYATTLAALNGNFADIGTNVSNFGSSSQTGTGISASQFVFNTTASLAINGATAATYNVFNGSIQSVTYSASIGAAKNLYMWTAFNNELAIVRNADGTGTSAWVTPASDLSGVTMNLSGLQVAAGGAMQSSEVLLGKIYDYSTGSDFIALIPEPSTTTLMMIGALGLVALRRLRKA